MKRNRTFLFATGLLVLAACQAETTPKTPEEPRECQAPAYQNLKWLNASVLETRDLPRGTRIILPDMAVTMDYRADRLNFLIGKTNRIERIFCG